MKCTLYYLKCIATCPISLRGESFQEQHLPSLVLFREGNIEDLWHFWSICLIYKWSGTAQVEALLQTYLLPLSDPQRDRERSCIQDFPSRIYLTLFSSIRTVPPCHTPTCNFCLPPASHGALLFQPR